MANNTSRTWRPTKGREIQDITDKINEINNTTPTIIIEKGSSGTGIVGVASFDGRTGAVTPLTGDYSASEITGFSTDGTLLADSDTNFPSQKAVKSYVDNSIANAANIDGGLSSSNNIFTITYDLGN